jgi:hypothetical protein
MNESRACGIAPQFRPKLGMRKSHARGAQVYGGEFARNINRVLVNFRRIHGKKFGVREYRSCAMKTVTLDGPTV